MRSRSLILALFAALYLPAIAVAQINTATVNGVVHDESKAVLPGATVTATDLETGRRYTAVSDERGAYQFSFPPGLYKMQAELAGDLLGDARRRVDAAQAPHRRQPRKDRCDARAPAQIGIKNSEFRIWNSCHEF